MLCQAEGKGAVRWKCDGCDWECECDVDPAMAPHACLHHPELTGGWRPAAGMDDEEFFEFLEAKSREAHDQLEKQLHVRDGDKRVGSLSFADVKRKMEEVVERIKETVPRDPLEDWLERGREVVDEAIEAVRKRHGDAEYDVWDLDFVTGDVFVTDWDRYFVVNARTMEVREL